MLLPSGKYFTGADLGWNNVVVGSGVTVDGLVVPWRIAFPIKRVTVAFELIAGTDPPNLNIQAVYIRADGTIMIGAFGTNVSLTTAAMGTRTNVVNFENNTATARYGTGNVAANTALLGSPFMRFSINNADAAPATYLLECAVQFQ